MFTDVVGSTALIAALGDQRWYDETRDHFSVLRQVLASFDGTEVKSTGDGLMAVFSSARQAALAAVAMQSAVEREHRLASSPVRIRIGLNAGEVVADEGDYFGAAVNVARRLCDAAASGQTLLSDVTVALIGSRAGLSLRPVGELELRGFDEPVGAHEAGPAADGDARSAPVLPAWLQISDRLPFVGRQRELATLHDEWRRARAERARLVTIAGEGGIGKSRLARQFAVAVAPDARHVVHGRCDEEHPVAFEPVVPTLAALVDALPPDALAALPARSLANLSRLVPALDVRGPERATTEPVADGDPARTRFDLLDAIVSIVTAAGREGPLLWVIDDIQWADHSTLLALRQILNAPVPIPLLIVATCREHETTGRPASSVVAELRAQSLETTIRLQGLDPDDIGGLVAASLGADHVHGDLAKSLYQRTDGHPLFVRELIGDLVDRRGNPDDYVIDTADVPQGVRPIIERRVERLGDAARELLSVAAVVGTRFDLEVVARVLGWPRDEFLSALDAALLSHEVEEVPGTPPACSFAHDLVRDTLYTALPAGRRADLHGRVAQAMEALHSDDTGPVLGALAYHFGVARMTGTARHAATYARQAGDRAMRQFAYEDAAAYYTSGLEQVTGVHDDVGLRGEMLVGLGQALAGSGDTEGARDAFVNAAAAARLAAAPDVFARAALGAGFGGAAVAYADRDLVELLEDAESMLAVGHHALRAQVQARLAREVFGGGDHARADALSTRALSSAQACDDPLALARALNARHQCLAGPDHLEERLEIQERAVDLAQRSGHHDAVLTSLAGLAVDHLRLGDFRGVDEALAAFDALAAKGRPSPLAAWYRATFEVMRAIVGGRLAEAEVLADEARSAGERAGAYNAAANHTAQLLGIRREQGRLGDLAEVIAAFATDPAVAGSKESTDVGWLFLHAQVLADTGDSDGARKVVDGVVARLAQLRRDDFWLVALALGAEATVAAGHHTVARRLYATLSPYAGGNLVFGGAVNCLGPVDRVLGLLAAAAGDDGAAETHFLEARRITDRMGGAGLRARTRMDYAAFLTARGRDAEGRAMAEDAARLRTDAGLERVR